jgi:hypothetical protein
MKLQLITQAILFFIGCIISYIATDGTGQNNNLASYFGYILCVLAIGGSYVFPLILKLFKK